jgi:hypothetical protein
MLIELALCPTCEFKSYEHLHPSIRWTGIVFIRDDGVTSYLAVLPCGAHK